MASEQGSISVVLSALKAGEDDAATTLWHRYAARLIRLTRNQLRNTNRRMADEEDVVLSAFDSFCRGAGNGQFAKLEDRGDLWQLLVLISVRKAADLSKHEQRLKRGGGIALGELIEDLVAVDQTPELASSTLEEYNRLLRQLGDDELKEIAVARMEGYTNAEIAERRGCTRQTVQRRLTMIRSLWEQELDAS